jgi:hypothetical protein
MLLKSIQKLTLFNLSLADEALSSFQYSLTRVFLTQTVVGVLDLMIFLQSGAPSFQHHNVHTHMLHRILNASHPPMIDAIWTSDWLLAHGI